MTTDLQVELKNIRLRARLNQDEFATALGIGRSTVASWENGWRSPTYKVLQKVAQTFGEDMDNLERLWRAEKKHEGKEPPQELTPLQKQLIAARVQKGMTQEGFADYLGISRSSVGMWESGSREPTGRVLSIISKKCDIPMADLLELQFGSGNDVPRTPGTDTVDRCMKYLKLLTEDQRKPVLAMLEAMVDEK